MFLYQTETDTHFQCPQCGQQGSVATELLNQALQDNVHVQISCVTCHTKFEAKFEAKFEPHGVTPDPDNLLAEFETATKTADATDEVEEVAALPSWLRSPEQAKQSAEQSTRDDKPKADAQKPVQDEIKTHTKINESVNTAPKPPEIKQEPDNSPFDAAVAGNTQAQTQDVQPRRQATKPEEPEDRAASHPPIGDTDNNPSPHFGALAAHRPGGDKPPPEAKPLSRAPVAINAILLLIVIGLTGINGYVLLRDHPRVTALFPVELVKSAEIKVQSAHFEELRDPKGDSVMVSVTFTNSGMKAGTIGDFKIDLQDADRQTLMSRTIRSNGETVPPNDSRIITSTLFAPPDGAAHVAVQYPLTN